MDRVDRDRIQIGTHSFEKYLQREAIKSRVHELGVDLMVDYHDKNPLFLVVLNGAFMFAADLVRACDFAHEVEFVKMASYGGLNASGEMKRLIGLPDKMEDRHILIVEDIVDTGKTIGAVREDLLQHKPASVEVVTLLLKPDCLECTFESPYVGFEIPPAFVVGYGLDIDGQARNFADIYQLKKGK
ncbi:MAG: hypoxanthine phosphoribosyltransferase [Saprospiraceae bacterium]|nr:hypoxanthine phosphoribosyltransferase [Saprospiraceae bacterium]